MNTNAIKNQYLEKSIAEDYDDERFSSDENRASNSQACIETNRVGDA